MSQQFFRILLLLVDLILLKRKGEKMGCSRAGMKQVLITYKLTLILSNEQFC